MNANLHIPVLLDEVIQALNIKPDAVVVDATYGRGGHAEEIMKRLGGSGTLVALDRDPHAVMDARRRFSADARAVVEQAKFSSIGRVCDARGITGRVDAILFDLGVSSPQLDDASRGFSFRHDGPLDMRMDPDQGVSAADWINNADESEIARVIETLGEERYARRVARAIARQRAIEPITNTRTLAELIAKAVPAHERKKDPATRTFQAIRLHINRELEEIDSALPEAVRVLAPGGRLAVISFHSLEDRRVKLFFREQSQAPTPPRGMPALPTPFHPTLRVIGRAIRASEEETRRNPRARSAVLRVAEREGTVHV